MTVIARTLAAFPVTISLCGTAVLLALPSTTIATLGAMSQPVLMSPYVTALAIMLLLYGAVMVLFGLLIEIGTGWALDLQRAERRVNLQASRLDRLAGRLTCATSAMSFLLQTVVLGRLLSHAVVFTSAVMTASVVFAMLLGLRVYVGCRASRLRPGASAC